jgi:hypothetical protein
VSPRPSRRRALNWLNGTTPAGLALAALACSAARQPGPRQSMIAGGYRLVLPAQPCFTVGDVIFCRYDADWLVRRPELLGHELRHTEQYALFGPLFLPLYAAASGWSWLTAGDYASRNVFERHAGLAAGGYL